MNFLLISFFLLFSHDNEWNLQKDKDGIQVFTRKYNNYKQIKAVTMVDASANTLAAIIKDSESANQWIDRVKAFKDLKINSESDWITYGEIEIPWPFQNKDIITQNNISQNTKTHAINVSIISIPDYIPSQSGKHRIRKSEGNWQFTPLENGKTEVIYTVYAEQDGVLPQWVVTPLVVNSIFNTMLKLKPLSADPKYQTVKIRYPSY